MRRIDINDRDALKLVGELEGADFVTTMDATDKLINRFNGTDIQRGDLLPWEKTHKIIQLRPCEVSLWGGFNGHGKSQLLGQIAAWNLKYKKWAIASLEMPYVNSLERVLRQISGERNPSDDYIRQFTMWADEKLWYYDRLDSIPWQVMIGVITYAAEELKVNHFVIDSLVKCRIGREDYDSQMRFVEKLTGLAKQFKMHIHLLHHMRKKESEDTMPTKFDFRGAGELTDLVDNVFIAYRNKKKERLIRQDKAKPEDLEKPDQFLNCDKQRYGEWEGSIGLWFDQESLQYKAHNTQQNMHYHELG